MKQSLRGTLLLTLPVATGFATALFQGNFAADDQAALFNITANTSETFTIETDSYAGGNLESAIIPAGGFEPAAFLFDDVGNVPALGNGTRGQVGKDPTAMGCDSVFFQAALGPRAFTVALGVYDNSPVGASVADGFVQDGNPGFTCRKGGRSGSFCDLTSALGTFAYGQLRHPSPGRIPS